MSLLLSDLTSASKGRRFDVTLRLELEDAEPFPFNYAIKGFKGKNGAIFSINQSDLVDLKLAPPVTLPGDVYLDSNGCGWRVSYSNGSSLFSLKGGERADEGNFFRDNPGAVRIHREPVSNDRQG
jgi:hypothetical protein